MKPELWPGYAASLKECDIVFEVVKSGVGEIIEWGTEQPGDKIVPCHVFMKRAGNATVEADGKAVDIHNINEYKDKVVSGASRLIGFTLNNLTPDKVAIIEATIDTQIGEAYNWFDIAVYSVWGVINKVSSWLGGLLEKIPNPMYNPKFPVCSIQTVLALQKLSEYYNPMVSDMPINNMTPEAEFDRITRIATQTTDTANYV